MPIKTPVAPAAGEIDTIVGRVVSISGCTAVVNDQRYSDASELPAKSFTAVEMTAVYTVAYASVVTGAKVKILFVESSETVPLTSVVPAYTLYELAFVVAGVTGSENVAETEVLTATLVAPDTGRTETTVGRVVSVPLLLLITVLLERLVSKQPIKNKTLESKNFENQTVFLIVFLLRNGWLGC